MRFLLDTNVLLRIAQMTSPHHASARIAVLQLAQAGNSLYIVPQVVYEYWAVATRPVAVNGLGMTPDQARLAVAGLVENYHLLKDERGIFGNWQKLVAAHAVQGKTSHDARLVAAMVRHGLTHLLSFNVADFARFSATIAVVTPDQVLAGTPQPSSSKPPKRAPLRVAAKHG